jgi:predicted nucleic acid-binding protein
VRRFLDTNVLVYADDLDAGDKRERAQTVLAGILAAGDGVLSTQVLQEFFSISTRKLGVDPTIARRKVELLAEMDLVRIDLDLILAAIDLSRLHSFSFWDALIVQVVDGVRIENPFL